MAFFLRAPSFLKIILLSTLFSFIFLQQQTKASDIQKEIKAAIDLSAQYLIEACDTNGKFVYRINLNPRITYPPMYNMLRHAGTMYAIGMCEIAHPNKKLRATLNRTAAFLKDKSIRPIKDRKDLLAVWSFPEITGKDAKVQIKLGGTGLGLTALVLNENISPGTTQIDILRKMGRFIVYMQKKDGGFYSKYISDEGGRTDKWTSLYYPGEAILGLLMLYEKDPQPIWLNTAEKGLIYLANMRQGKRIVEPDHWALLATAKLFSIYHKKPKPSFWKKILLHASQISNSILMTRAQHPFPSKKHGCFTNEGRTTPTATRLEGLMAILPFLDSLDDDLKDKIKTTIAPGVYFLLRSQIKSGPYKGGIPRSIWGKSQKQQYVEEKPNLRDGEIRIDYVQHTLSAMLQYEQLSLSKKEGDKGLQGSK